MQSFLMNKLNIEPLEEIQKVWLIIFVFGALYVCFRQTSSAIDKNKTKQPTNNNSDWKRDSASEDYLEQL